MMQCLKSARKRHRRTEPSIQHERTPRFHLFHRRRQWNAERRQMDGLGTKARQAAGVQSAAARRSRHQFHRQRQRMSLAGADPLRDNARLRHAIAPRCGAQADRRGNSSAQSSGSRSDARTGHNGYGILQPRVSISLESASRSMFAQHLLRQHRNRSLHDRGFRRLSGSFRRRKLYRQGSLRRRRLSSSARRPGARESLLSHDLFESLFARAALVTDIELLDDYPAHYDSLRKTAASLDTRRLADRCAGCFPRAGCARGTRSAIRLPLISRWKILDNLRRSLVAPSMILWLLAAWTILPGSPLLWSLFVVITIAFPVYLHVTTSLLIHPRGIPWTSHFWSVWGDVRTNTAQVALSLVFLPHQAYLMCDAIVRTIYRKLFHARITRVGNRRRRRKTFA